MEESSPRDMYSRKEEGAEVGGDEINTAQDIKRCVRINLNQNLDACIKNKTLVRDHVQPILCDSELTDKVVLNYIIVKQILRNLSWQDKFLCKHVCSTWWSAVKTLKKEQLSPQDFVFDQMHKAHLVKSGNFYTEPMAVLTFVNNIGFSMEFKCQDIEPSCCPQPCNGRHVLLDVVDKMINAPKKCHFIVRSDYINYMPLSDTKTKQYMVSSLDSLPFVGGLYVPAIPNVQFDTINLRAIDVQQFYGAVDRIVNNRVIKGVIVFVNEIFLLRSYKEIMFLNYFKDVQPDIPYALGGCLVNDTLVDDIDFDGLYSVDEKEQFVSGSLLTAGLFTVPKDMESTQYNNFEMFSLVLKTSDWSKNRIEHYVFEFAKQIPHFEHSAIIKFSCVGRDVKHLLEKEIIRAAFPNTRIVGCYGNGELGLNHPEITQKPTLSSARKKFRKDSGPHHGLMYSYSSVIVFMGWGKMDAPPAPANKQ